MEIFRVSIKRVDGSFSILDRTFSQVCEMLRGCSDQERDWFWDKRSVTLPNGEAVKFVKEV
jgi:hypothetical protein